MISEYKFLKTKKGKTYFAKIKLSTISDEVTEIQWPEYLNDIKKFYFKEVEDGIKYAFSIYRQRENKHICIEIKEVVVSNVDTTPEVVYCTAFIATWKALGGNENEIEIIYDDKKLWHPKIK